MLIVEACPPFDRQPFVFSHNGIKAQAGIFSGYQVDHVHAEQLGTLIQKSKRKKDV